MIMLVQRYEEDKKLVNSLKNQIVSLQREFEVYLKDFKIKNEIY